MDYLELLKKYVKNNKYTNGYISIVKRSKDRILTGYSEKHHILPKSFKLGGEKDKENLAVLTAREHFICHRLLVKMMICPKQKKKMQKAVGLLYKNLNRKGAKAYEYMRILCVKESSNLMKDLGKDQEYKDKMYKSREGYYKDKDRQKEHSEYLKELMKDPEYKKMCVDPMLEAHKYIDHTSKEGTERSFHSKEGREKCLVVHKSDEHRENCRKRELSKGKEKLSELGKNRKNKQIENAIAKYGSIEAANKAHSDKIKGRVKIRHNETGVVKVVRNPEEYLLIGGSLVKQIKPEKITEHANDIRSNK